MNEEIDLKDIKRELRRKYGYKSDIIQGDFINGVTLKGVIGEYIDYEEVESISTEIHNYIQENWECFCDFDILSEGMEVVFNIY